LQPRYFENTPLLCIIIITKKEKNINNTPLSSHHYKTTQEVQMDFMALFAMGTG